MRCLIVAVILNIATVALTIIACFSQTKIYGLWNIIKVEMAILIFWGFAVFLGMAISQFLKKQKGNWPLW